MTEEIKPSVIQTVYDAINDVTANIATGSVEKVLVKRLNEDGSPKVTTFKDKNTGQQKNINNTHRYALLLKNGEDQSWVSFGEGEVKNLKYENQFQVKQGEKYVSIQEGMVIRLPVTLQSYQRKSDGQQVTAVVGKKKQIKITDSSGARSQSSSDDTGTANSHDSSTAPPKKGKVYGEITSIDGNDVIVKQEDGSDVPVKLTSDQVDKIVLGGRMTGLIAEDGTVSSGFKAYGPKSSTPSAHTSKSGYGGKRDNSGMETGHALNGALNLQRGGLTTPSVVEIAKVVHDVTKELKQEATGNPMTKGMSEYDIGAMVGHAVLNASRDISVGENDNPVEVSDKLKDYSYKLLSEVVPLVSAYVKGENTVDTNKEGVGGNNKEEHSPKEKENSIEVTSGHINMAPPEIDFDDDIPF